MAHTFDFYPKTRIVFGAHSLKRLGELAIELKVKNALIVTDPGIIATGHIKKTCEYLEKENIATHIFSGVTENPTTKNVNEGVAIAQQQKIDLIVGFGGGSSMDCAKGINFILTNGGQIADYWGYAKAKKAMLPMIGIPTTTGTGSEAQCYALISDHITHKKMVCGDPKAAFKIAILDPIVTQTQPQSVIAATGIDAISHAIESAVTQKRNSFSTIFSHQAWKLLCENFCLMFENPKNENVSGAMQLGACYSGIAIENSMLGATHSCANPLTKNYGIVHGHAIAIMLPHIIRYNSVVAESLYQELCEVAGISYSGSPGDALAQKIELLRDNVGLPTSLKEYDIKPSSFSKLALEACKEWTAQFNPRSITETDIISLYEKAFS